MVRHLLEPMLTLLTQTQMLSLPDTDLPGNPSTSVMATTSSPVALPSLPVELFDNILDRVRELIDKDLRQMMKYSSKRKRASRQEKQKRVRLSRYLLRLACREISKKTRRHFARHYFTNWRFDLNKEAAIEDFYTISKDPDFSATLRRVTVAIEHIECCHKPCSIIDTYYSGQPFLNGKDKISMISEAISHLDNLHWLGFEEVQLDLQSMLRGDRWVTGVWKAENAHILRVVEAFLLPIMRQKNAVSTIGMRILTCDALGLDIKFFKQTNSFRCSFGELQSLTLAIVNLEEAGEELEELIFDFVVFLNNAPNISSLDLRSNLSYRSADIIKHMSTNLNLPKLNRVYLQAFRFRPKELTSLIRSHQECLTVLHFTGKVSAIEGSWKTFLKELWSDPAGLRILKIRDAYDDCRRVRFKKLSGRKYKVRTADAAGGDMSQKISHIVGSLVVGDIDSAMPSRLI
ncbi:hypothetical protein BU16DRAFT_539401 [Lophium mytilinum]|uniref:F-box domain-containing protein n=1 Tax=Lophium mytilinum TaxID=390894 RepID=A0A6A6QSQ6_9PEZI|nr:hypothetical protein BU16DRAFT_539401 [Lophium mytilinum]